MLQMNMRVRTRTLEHAIGHLCATDNALVSHEMSVAPQYPPMPRLSISTPPEFSTKLIEKTCTRLALQLLFAAKQHRHQRTKQMLQSLIDACLLQGEILVVSFLFAFLVKQWQIRQTIDSDKGTLEMLSEVDPFPIHENSLRQRESALSIHHHYPYPDPSFMIKMLLYIDASLCNEPLLDGSFATADQGDCIQALAILASLLEEKALPFPNATILIRSLHSYPAASGKVWVRRRRKWQKEDVQAYFLGVLDGLIEKVITSNKDPPRKQHHNGEKLEKDLDRLSYNSLLRYSLRHRKSPAQAEAIIQHMCGSPDPARRPNIKTFNILLREGTLLRRNDIVLKTLQLLKLNSTAGRSSRADTLHDAFTEDNRNALQRRSTVPRYTNPRLKNLSEPFKLHIPKASLRAKSTVMNADTANICVAYLTATGSPGLAANILFLFFPELKVDGSSEAEGKQRKPRQLLVERAVLLGPKFFTAILNALCKDGRTGLAERLWFIAKDAELLSCDPAYTPASGPWSLPMEAYTIMMQCYASERKKGYLDVSRHYSPSRKTRALGWGNRLPPSKQNSDSRILSSSRHVAARHMGWFLLQSFLESRKRTQDIAERARSRKQVERVVVNAPDGRFFNAALRLFGRPWRRHGYSPSYWHRLARRRGNVVHHNGPWNTCARPRFDGSFGRHPKGRPSCSSPLFLFCRLQTASGYRGVSFERLVCSPYASTTTRTSAFTSDIEDTRSSCRKKGNPSLTDTVGLEELAERMACNLSFC